MERIKGFFKENGMATVLVTLLISLATTFSTIYINYADSTNTILNSDVDRDTKNIENCLTLYNELKLELTYLKDENKRLKAQVTQLMSDKLIGETNSLIFNGMIDDIPFPVWLKSRDGKMIKLNKAYEEKFLVPNGLSRHQYVNGLDTEVWNQSESDKFRQHDLEVMANKKTMAFQEKFKVGDKEYDVMVYKFPIYANANTNFVVGVGGIIIVI